MILLAIRRILSTETETHNSFRPITCTVTTTLMVKVGLAHVRIVVTSQVTLLSTLPSKEIHLHWVINNKIYRNHRVDFCWVTFQLLDCIPHGSKVYHCRNATTRRDQRMHKNEKIKYYMWLRKERREGSLEEGGNNLEELTVLNVHSVWFNNQCDNTVPL